MPSAKPKCRAQSHNQVAAPRALDRPSRPDQCPQRPWVAPSPRDALRRRRCATSAVVNRHPRRRTHPARLLGTLPVVHGRDARSCRQRSTRQGEILLPVHSGRSILHNGRLRYRLDKRMGMARRPGCDYRHRVPRRRSHLESPPAHPLVGEGQRSTLPPTSYPARRSAYGRPIGSKSGLRRAAAIAEKVAR